MDKRWLAIAVSVCALAVAPSTAFAGGNDGIGGQEVSQIQSATNQNSTEQSASSEASSDQANVNAPVTVDSPGSNNGDVNQSNGAYNNASSTNYNETQQENAQDQRAAAVGATNGGGDSCGCGNGGSSGQRASQEQSASNENSTEQAASSEASSHQVNVNAPVTVDSPGSSNGDVNQGNKAENSSHSTNANSADQQNQQDQAGSAQGTTSGSDSCGCEDGKNGSSGGQEVSQGQSAGNENDTYQSASSEASSRQVNVNAPITVDSPGSSNGDVNQGNKAENKASSTNYNETDQQNKQDQGAAAVGATNGGDEHPGRCCHGAKKGWGDTKKGKGHDGQHVDQTQSASNGNSTDQSAQGRADSEQENVNAPFTIDSPCSGNGDVNQFNWVENNASSTNGNDTEQENDQDQAGSAVAAG